MRGALSPREEILVPYPPSLAAEPQATHCRGTLLAASISALKRHDLYDRYLLRLPAEHHEAIVASVASAWLPIEIGVAHYRACDALAVPIDDQLALGGE